ncbi:MAG TPA: FAD/NAD(P)-binding protein, partial [Flavisolibacter sp.]|nr:FAD/NAD(P)-binding protein [Flavisolibacter sp.]
MKKVTIIGGGFTGTMTAVQILHHATEPVLLTIINQKQSFTRGIAYQPYSKKHLLNVAAAKMSAFRKDPNHFLDWVMMQDAYCNKDRNLVAQAFLPRFLYGQYLEAIWKDSIELQIEKKLPVEVLDTTVTGVEVGKEHIIIDTKDGQQHATDYLVIATGNHLPGNPSIKNKSFFESKNYYQNPWLKNSVSGADSTKPVMIVGNGLTMVDTVIGLREQGYNGIIYSVSPNGFNILPHRHNGLVYTRMIDELTEDADLYQIVCLFNKHRKQLKELGVSPEPLIDSMRVYTQQIWKRLSMEERKKFMGRLRHLWGVARHRIPLHIYEWLQQQRIEGKLHVQAGRLMDIHEEDNRILV